MKHVASNHVVHCLIYLLVLYYEESGKSEGRDESKAVPLHVWTDPDVSSRLRLPDYRRVGTWRWQGCKLYAPAHFTPHEIFLILIVVTGWVDFGDLVLPEGLCQLRIPMTPSVIEPANCWLVTQYFNQLRHQILPWWIWAFQQKSMNWDRHTDNTNQPSI
jgi:hypothetical protein